ncbi:MAG: hypothetical protein L6R40_005817 [Gallowayella cf. fulva]|nr:MAG: hypothetical protein L6R40_005817 [Xanthomendoza cf. fulva]
MAPQCPSIQSFFPPSPAGPEPAVTTPDEDGAAFTTTEVKAFLYSTPHAWKPRFQYENLRIAKLAPGPYCVCLLARVVNLYEQPTSTTKLPYATKRSLNVLVRDDTGMVKVKLWYLKVDYQLRLGQLVSVWTTLVSKSDISGTVSVNIQNAACTIDIFPERDSSCYFMVQADKEDGSLSRTPLGYNHDKQLADLMTLKSFVEGGHDVPTARVLVCVKSIGGRKKFTTKKGNVLDIVHVMIFDDTYDATLALSGRIATSAAYWKPSNTILLLNNPSFRDDKKATLSIGPNTYVDVDPCMADAEWLRAFAQGLTTREAINVPFPEGGRGNKQATYRPSPLTKPISQRDSVRENPSEDFVGYLCVSVLEMNITTLHQRSRIFCAECYGCGVPLYANTTTTKCKHCHQEIILGLNPRLIGTLIDETGAIDSGKLVLSTIAWEQLLGRTAEELARCDSLSLKYLENRLLFLRLTLVVGWSEKVGRLCVFRVQNH